MIERRAPWLLAGLVVAIGLEPVRPEWSFWVESGTTRVLRSATPGTSTRVQLAAARGEWESFQILLRSNDGAKEVTVDAADLAGPSGAALLAKDARLFRQHQLELKVGTYRNDDFAPDWYPDPLIPFDHPSMCARLDRARFRAVPFDLPANETHGFWVDVHVPPDARPGEYRGRYRVRSGGGQSVEIPVSLTVWDFTLPRVSTLKTALGSPAGRMRGYYRELAKAGKAVEPSDWTAVEAQCAELVSRHRVNATPPPGMLRPVREADGSYRIPSEQVAALRDFVDRYHVNAVQVPRPTGIAKDPERDRETLHAWLRSWDVCAAELERPGLVFYTYLKDEPNDEEAYRFVQKWGRAIHEAESVIQVLVVEQTWTQNEAWGDLYGAIDIWCPLFSLFKPESAAERQALGETIWTYTALCQGEPTPWWHIDYPLLNYRAPAWIAWRYRMSGLLYWGGMSYWRGVNDPWLEPDTYPNRSRRGDSAHPRLYNGEGTLVYPGRAVGYDGIAPSLRLKALRDGIEDYEYLALLERAGLAEEAQRVVLPLATSWFLWDRDPAAYGEARAKLAEMIVASRTKSGTERKHPE